MAWSRRGPRSRTEPAQQNGPGKRSRLVRATFPPAHRSGSFLAQFVESIATALFKYSPRQFAQGELTFSPVVPPLVLGVLLLVALVVVVRSARALAVTPRDRILLGTLRALAFALLALC